MHYLDAAVLMDDEFGWDVCMLDTQKTGKIKVTKPDGDIEFLSKEEFVAVAKEMWNTAKDNGLDAEYAKEIEDSYKII
ncbi:hypothetical protein CHH80_03560 [Bacillus sp. 7504-2]|nr:hypothetical protein CHH80_03560 [Bacillus sp. 7504-2]